MAEEKLRPLFKEIGGIKSAITRISSAVLSCGEAICKHFLTVRLASLTNLSAKYDEIQSEIELYVDGTDLLAVDRIEVEEILFSTETKLLQLLDSD